MLADVGGPLGPFLWLLQLLVWAVQAMAWVALQITENVIVLGPWWVVAYWLLLFVLLHLGDAGAEMVRQTRQGNDYWEFDPKRKGGDWAGKWRVGIVRWQIRLESAIATSSLLVGYLGAVALLLVGFLGLWALPGLALLILRRVLRHRNRRRQEAQ